MRQREKPVPVYLIGHQRVKRLGEAVGRRAFLDDVVGDEGGDRLVGHPADDLADHPLSLGARSRSLREHFQHHVGREPADRHRHVAKDRLELIGSGPGDRLSDAAQHPDEGGRLRRNASVARGGLCIELRHQLLELARIASDA